MKRIKVRKGQYRIMFDCEYCGVSCSERESHYLRKEKHYCSRKCYSLDRCRWPKENQHAYGKGLPAEERKRRIKCRSDTNHAIRDGKLERMPCEICGDIKSEAHHDDYSKPLDIRWLCFKHHRMHHENPELLETES